MKMRRTRTTIARATLATLLTVGLAATVTAAEGLQFKTELLGTNEVPSADPDGRGRAEVTIDVEGGTVCFDVSVKDTGTPNRAHIHVGAAGGNGGIVVPFFELVGQPGDALNDVLEDKGRAQGCVTADPVLLAQIAANPAGYYVNLHNARFPGGAVRGQLDD